MAKVKMLEKGFYSKHKQLYRLCKSAGVKLISVALLTIATQVVYSAEDTSDTGSIMRVSDSDKLAGSRSGSKLNKDNPEDIINLEPITVFATPESLSLTIPDIDESQKKLDQVPGGTSLIDGKRIQEGAAFTVTDVLAYAPGVYVGDSQASVTGGSRISIRGSDINSSFIPISGIKFLRNGLPFTNANGFTDTETLNLNSIQHIEVYRGANALEYGGSNLGGAINFITPTGYTADSLKIGMTLGANGYLNPRFSGGGELGKGWDAYTSFSYINFDGNRANSNQELFYGYGNIGYRWNEDQETRLDLDIQNITFQLPFSLTKQQLNENPHQSHANPSDKPSGFPVYRMDLQHTIRMDGGDTLDFGAYYFVKDNDYNFKKFGFFHDLWQDAGLSWRHQINGELFHFNNRIVWGGLSQWLWINDVERKPVDVKPGDIRFNEQDKWNNVEAYLQDQLSLTDTLTLVIGGQINYRSIGIVRLFPALEPGLSSPAQQDFFNFNPKLGFTWQATPQAQFYANVSRSAQPSPIDDLKNIFQTPALTSQTGTTIEIGTRGGSEQFKWDLAIYHAWLNQELLTIPTPPNFVNFTTTNAKSTVHTGIELGLEGNIALGLFAADDHLRLRGSYTWSRFAFDNDPKLGDNRLPGIPEHNGRFEMLYQHPSGFYIGPNVTSVSSNWVDFTHTLSASPYTLLGARIGWDDGKHWKVFVDGRNLTNEYYAASVFVTGDARVRDTSGRGTSLFNPGSTRMVFAGFEYRY
jgi:iron complex outermembrane recepter protein